MNQINPHPIIRFFQRNGLLIFSVLAILYLCWQFPYQFAKPKPTPKAIEAIHKNSDSRVVKSDSLISIAETEIKKSAQIQKQRQNSKKIENEALQQIPTTHDSIFNRVRAFSAMSNEAIRKTFDNGRTPEHQ